MATESADIPFRQIFENSLSAISVHTIVLDHQGRPVDYRFDAVNPRFEVFTGLKAGAILGKTVREVLPGTEEVWIERYGQVALTGESQTFTSHSQELGKWYAVSAFQHKPLGFTVSFLDITDVKRAEEDLQQSGRQFETMVRNMQVGVLLQGPRAEIVMGNPKALELLGLTLDQLLGKTSFDPEWRVVHEDGSPFPGSTHPVPQAIAAKAPVRDVVMGVFRPRTGDLAWLLVDAEPLFGEGGAVEQVVCTFIDISARKRAQEAWRESEQRLERVLEGSQLGYWDWDIVTGKVHRNARWAEMLGYTLEEIELSVQQWSHLHHPEDKDRAWASIRDHLEGRTPVHRIEYRMRCKDGQYKWILDQAKIVARDSQGRPLRMSGTHTDIDDQKRAEEEHNRLQALLQQSQKMENLGSLAGGIAHDMNNVLAAILTLASAKAVRLPADDPHLHAFETISKAAERGGKMVKSLLEFARQSPVEEKVLDLNAIILDEVRLLEHTTFSQVTIKVDLSPSLKPVVGDSGALSHALMNLCVNAVDAMPASGTLSLRTRNADPGVEVLVEDTGTGMAPEVLVRAMDPFFTTKPVGKGTGLGLSLAYSTVQAHHGRLSIESAPGRGTVVTIWFPDAVLAQQEPEEPIVVGQAAPSHSLEVLLVDDDELVRDSLSATLAAWGFAFRAVASGEEALALVGTGFLPDVIILDLNMPGLGGSETLAGLRAKAPHLPVILSTGRVDQSALNLVAAHPGVTLLSKPFAMGELNRHLELIRPVSSPERTSETLS